jgi:hypothetical protein
MTTLTGTEKQIAQATKIQAVLAEMINIGVEQLIRIEAINDAKENGSGSYETDGELIEAVNKIVARKVATLNKPKEAKGIARIKNYTRITDASDLIALGEGLELSWNSFFKIMSRIRGDHFSYLD